MEQDKLQYGNAFHCAQKVFEIDILQGKMDYKHLHALQRRLVLLVMD